MSKHTCYRHRKLKGMNVQLKLDLALGFNNINYFIKATALVLLVCAMQMH